MTATTNQVNFILNHENTVNAMTRGKSLKSFLFGLSKAEASVIIERLEDGEQVEVGK